VLLPLLAFLLGMAATSLIPGCHCDEGAGCGGCGANGLVSLLLFGGFIGGLMACFTLLPASLVVGAIVAFVSDRKK
jgi:hypothetical protein